MDVVALFQSVAGSDDTAYIQSAEGRVARANAAWRRFAEENGGGAALASGGRGASIYDAISPPLRAFYRAAFDRALSTGERWEHDYDCSSPNVLRTFRMLVYPASEVFLVVVHSLRVERPHDLLAHAADDATFAPHGVITMCSHCRRVRNHRGVDRWDWVPDYLGAPPKLLSHGLCGACVEFHYPGERSALLLAPDGRAEDANETRRSDPLAERRRG